MESVQLWLATPDAAQHFDPAELSDAERDRMSRIRRATTRQEFAVSRALRAHVSRDVHPTASQSLSHSGGYAALARTHPGLRVGVDVELHRPRDVLVIARTTFSESEVRALEPLGDCERQRLFYAMWTVKEALAKALQLPLLQALRSCELVVDARTWQVNLPASAQGSVAVYQPRADLTLAVVCIGATASIECWNWPPQREAAWPLIAAIALATADAPAAKDHESAGAARAAAPASGSGTGGNSCGCAPARPAAAS